MPAMPAEPAARASLHGRAGPDGLSIGGSGTVRRVTRAPTRGFYDGFITV